MKPLFNVIVVATMGAGKSTVINALIGKELLHSANEATTATITRIHDKDNLPFFSGNAYSYQNELVAEENQIDATTLRKWNADKNIKTIDLIGDILALQNSKAEIVLYDTPGPNNSQDDSHEALTMEVIKDGHYGLILYVLNATQIGVNDDRNLLVNIQQSLAKDPKKKIIFLLNKSDQLDQEKGESLGKVVQNVENYLSDIGFKELTIIPTAANQALIANKVLNGEKLTRSERNELKLLMVPVQKQFVFQAKISKKVKEQALSKLKHHYSRKRIVVSDDFSVTRQKLKRIVMQSGFGIISCILQKELDNTDKQTNRSNNCSNHRDGNKSDKQEKNRFYQFSTTNNSYNGLRETDKKSIDRAIQLVQKISFKSLLTPTQEKIMNNIIRIEHNPFTIETKFFINNQEIENISFFENKKRERLQLWVEELFTNLYHTLNGPTHFNIEFKGVKADFLDLQSEAERFGKENGITFNLKHEPAREAAERLEEIELLIDEAKKIPALATQINSDAGRELKAYFENTENKDFNIYVAATMSAGKSTLINAMLGTDLLPAGNEATTATIAKIKDSKSQEKGVFKGKRLDKDGYTLDDWQKVDLNTLKAWNVAEGTFSMELEGNILGMTERDNVRLVITDTPGPNNSQNNDHSRTTMGYIQDTKQENPLILYILNATQLGTNDDKNTLTEIANYMKSGGKQAKDRFIFVVNKVDQFDPEKGEHIDEILERVRQYLVGCGIEHPLIYPVSAQFTNLFRRRELNPDNLSRSERNNLAAMEDLFTEEESMNLAKYMALSRTAKENLAKRKLPIALERSGLSAVEAMIDEYIDKYNLPHQVNKATEALISTIKLGETENTLTVNLAKDKAELDKLRTELEALQKNQTSSTKAKVQMEKIINDKHALYPAEIIDQFNEEQAKIRREISNLQEDFVRDGSCIEEKQANRRIDRLTDDVQFQANALSNRLETICSKAEEITRQKLGNIFDQYVKDVFADLDKHDVLSDRSVSQNLADKVRQLGASSLNLALDEDEVEIVTERVKTGTETKWKSVAVGTRSTSKWYNPFSWGSSKTIYEDRPYEVDVYSDITKNMVDPDEIWYERERKISSYLNNMTSSARNAVEENVKDYANKFKNFMEQQFKILLDQVIGDIKAKISDQDTLDKEIEKANNALEQLNAFKTKLDEITKL